MTNVNTVLILDEGSVGVVIGLIILNNYIMRIVAYECQSAVDIYSLIITLFQICFYIAHVKFRNS